MRADLPPLPDLDTLRLAELLIACASVTPRDAGCQALIAERLEAIGFDCETLVFGTADAAVTNLWALRRGGVGRAEEQRFAVEADGPKALGDQRLAAGVPRRDRGAGDQPLGEAQRVEGGQG